MNKQVEIKMSNPMEATPIAHLVQLANQYNSSIYFEKDTIKVNAKSIMGMMSLVLSQGSMINIVAEGDDEAAAIEALEQFLTN